MATLSMGKFKECLLRIMGIKQQFPQEVIDRYDNKAGASIKRYFLSLYNILKDSGEEGVAACIYVFSQLALLVKPLPESLININSTQSVSFTTIQQKYKITAKDAKVIPAGQIPLSFCQKLGLGGACEIANEISGNVNFYNLYGNERVPTWFCTPLLSFLDWKPEIADGVDRVMEKFEEASSKKAKRKPKEGKILRDWTKMSARRGKTDDSILFSSLFSHHTLIGSLLATQPHWDEVANFEQKVEIPTPPSNINNNPAYSVAQTSSVGSINLTTPQTQSSGQAQRTPNISTTITRPPTTPIPTTPSFPNS
jgi:hypothetical protein